MSGDDADEGMLRVYLWDLPPATTSSGAQRRRSTGVFGTRGAGRPSPSVLLLFRGRPRRLQLGWPGQGSTGCQLRESGLHGARAGRQTADVHPMDG